MKRLEPFKSIHYLKGNNPVLFTEIGSKIIDTYGNEKGFSPFVIFYSKEEDTYYYIKSRNAKRDAKHPKYGWYKKMADGEIFIKKSDKELFTKDSYVDCSQIFKIDADLLESIINTDHLTYQQTKQLPQNIIDEILNKINECCNEEPPYLSILEIYKIGKELNARSLYLCDDKFLSLEKKSDAELWNESLTTKLYEAFSEQYGYKFDIAIKFKETFQKKYFSYKSISDKKEDTNNESEFQDDVEEDNYNQSSGMKI